MRLALILALTLTGCASDRAYFDTAQREATAEAVVLDPDAMMDAVCIVKTRKPMSQEWRGYCERRGIRAT